MNNATEQNITGRTELNFIASQYASTEQAGEDKVKTEKWEKEKKKVPPPIPDVVPTRPPLPDMGEEGVDYVDDEDEQKTDDWEEGKGY